jgi:hypothetical protein
MPYELRTTDNAPLRYRSVQNTALWWLSSASDTCSASFDILLLYILRMHASIEHWNKPWPLPFRALSNSVACHRLLLSYIHTHTHTYIHTYIHTHIHTYIHTHTCTVEDSTWYDYDGARLCLRTAATNRPIVHPPGDISIWRAMVVMMPAGYNSWLVNLSSLAVLPAETSGESRRNGRRSENFAYQYLKYLKGSLTCRKILRHGTPDFTSHPKEVVLRIFIALKNPSTRPGFKPWPLVQWQAH